MRAQPLIAVADVEAASPWYQEVLGCRSGHGGTEYERLLAGEKQILQLHDWQVDHHHGAIGDPTARPYGNGVLLWFEVDDFEGAVARARHLGAPVAQDVHVNPNAGHREYWLRDLDGYVVVLASTGGTRWPVPGPTAPH